MADDSIFSNFDIDGVEHVPPSPARLYEPLRNLGYKIDQAIADLVDNSINAKAAHVLIRFVYSGEKIMAVVIADDGSGMSDGELSEAMRLGTIQDYQDTSLGKYGLGLKLASLSHARVLSVITKRHDEYFGRRWTPESFADGWKIEKLSRNVCNDFFDAQGVDFLDHSESGTLVVWQDIDRIPIQSKGVDATIEQIEKKLKVQLGLHFHRFIEDGRLEIRIDRHKLNTKPSRIYKTVNALNPFGYSQSGANQFPKVFNVKLPDIGHFSATAHIWPPNSTQREYKLGGRTAAMQGFYFYRNDRLIQAGGWNGVVEAESEPHGSLARVMIDLPPALDSHFGLNVQKSTVVSPSIFEGAVRTSLAADGTRFSEYRAAAERTYRQKDERAVFQQTAIPQGIGRPLEMLSENLILGDSSHARRITMRWSRLESDDFFAISDEDDEIIINSLYRDAIMGARRKSSADAPVLKLLLFFLTKDLLYKERISKKRRDEMEVWNRLLSEAAKTERG